MYHRRAKSRPGMFGGTPNITRETRVLPPITKSHIGRTGNITKNICRDFHRHSRDGNDFQSSTSHSVAGYLPVVPAGRCSAPDDPPIHRPYFLNPEILKLETASLKTSPTQNLFSKKPGRKYTIQIGGIVKFTKMDGRLLFLTKLFIVSSGKPATSLALKLK